MEDSQIIKLGTPAPAFTLNSGNGQPVCLADFRGQQNVVLFFMRAFI